MERTDYLKICQLHAVYEEQMHTLELVKAKDVVYKPAGYLLTFDRKGNAKHTAVLKDLKANSLTYCPLSDVERAKKY